MTLEPGIHDPSQAPWWEFHCDGFTPVVEQWMNDAARRFAGELSKVNAGGKVERCRPQYLSLDGSSGRYSVKLAEHRKRFYLTVVRGDMQPKPEVRHDA